MKKLLSLVFILASLQAFPQHGQFYVEPAFCVSYDTSVWASQYPLSLRYQSGRRLVAVSNHSTRVIFSAGSLPYFTTNSTLTADSLIRIARAKNEIWQFHDTVYHAHGFALDERYNITDTNLHRSPSYDPDVESWQFDATAIDYAPSPVDSRAESKALIRAFITTPDHRIFFQACLFGNSDSLFAFRPAFLDLLKNTHIVPFARMDSVLHYPVDSTTLNARLEEFLRDSKQAALDMVGLNSCVWQARLDELKEAMIQKKGKEYVNNFLKGKDPSTAVIDLLFEEDKDEIEQSTRKILLKQSRNHYTIREYYELRNKLYAGNISAGRLQEMYLRGLSEGKSVYSYGHEAGQATVSLDRFEIKQGLIRAIQTAMGKPGPMDMDLSLLDLYYSKTMQGDSVTRFICSYWVDTVKKFQLVSIRWSGNASRILLLPIDFTVSSKEHHILRGREMSDYYSSNDRDFNLFIDKKSLTGAYGGSFKEPPMLVVDGNYPFLAFLTVLNDSLDPFLKEDFRFPQDESFPVRYLGCSFDYDDAFTSPDRVIVNEQVEPFAAALKTVPAAVPEHTPLVRLDFSVWKGYIDEMQSHHQSSPSDQTDWMSPALFKLPGDSAFAGEQREDSDFAAKEYNKIRDLVIYDIKDRRKQQLGPAQRLYVYELTNKDLDNDGVPEACTFAVSNGVMLGYHCYTVADGHIVRKENSKMKKAIMDLHEYALLVARSKKDFEKKY